MSEQPTFRQAKEAGLIPDSITEVSLPSGILGVYCFACSACGCLINAPTIHATTCAALGAGPSA